MSILRYPGSKPFEKDQANIFFGRAKNIEELNKRISLESFTILCSKSGLGKSSLINAGLIPKVNKVGKFRPIYIRFLPFKREKITPLEKTGLRIRDGAANISTFLDRLIENEKTIWHDIKEQQLLSDNDQGILLIFDQFEEFFSYPPEQQLNFRKQLSEALNIPIPQRYWDIMDLYEKDKLPLNKKELALLQKNLDLRVLLSIREDRLHLLDDISDYLPTNSVNWYKLGALNRNAAKASIEKPAKSTEKKFDSLPYSYSSNALNHILDFLSEKGKTQIESSHLQIICSSIEQKVIAQNLKEVKLEHIGDLNKVIETYYDSCINAIPSEEQQEKARNLIEDDLFFYDGKQKTRLPLIKGKVLQKISQETLTILVDKHLLRSEITESGNFTYELSHDALLDTIFEAREKKLEVQKGLELREAKKKIEKQRLRILLVSVVAVLAILGLLYGLYNRNIAEQAQDETIQALETTRNEKINSILNNAKLNLEDNPTLSYRLAEFARKTHGDNHDLRKTILSVYNSVYFDNSFLGHTGAINSIQLNETEDRIISASDDNTAIIWDLEGNIIKKLEGHTAGINYAEFSASGNYIVTASNDNTGRLWKVGKDNTIEDVVVLKGHRNTLNHISISNDDQYIISAGDDKKSYVWNLNGVKIDSLVDGVKSEILWSGISSNRAYFFNYSNDSNLRKWEIQEENRNYKKHYKTRGGNSPLPFYRAESINKTITIAYKNRIHIYDDERNVFRKEELKFPFEIKSVALSNDDKTIAFSDAQNRFIIYNKETKKQFIAGQHEGLIYTIQFSPDGNFIATASEDQTVNIWSKRGALIHTFKGFEGHQTKIKFFKNNQYLLTASGSELKLWPFKKQNTITLEGHEDKVNNANFSFDKELIVSSSDDNSIKFWNLKGENIKNKPTKFPVKKTAFITGHPKTKLSWRYQDLLYTVGINNVLIWDCKNIDSLKIVKTYTHEEGEISGVDFNGDATFLLSADTKGHIFDWGNFDRNSGIREEENHPLAKITEPNPFQVIGIKYFVEKDAKGKDKYNIAFTFNAKSFSDVYIVPKTKKDTIENLYTLIQRSDVRKLSGHKENVNSIHFSTDGSKIVTTSDDNTVIVWDSKNQKALSVLRGHKDNVIDADFSEDGKYLVTCSADKTIKVWDVSDPNGDYYELFGYQEHTQKVNSVEFSKDNKYILSASDDHTIKLKPIKLDVADIIESVNNGEAFHGKIRELTEKEKEQYGIAKEEDKNEDNTSN